MKKKNIKVKTRVVANDTVPKDYLEHGTISKLVVKEEIRLATRNHKDGDNTISFELESRGRYPFPVFANTYRKMYSYFMYKYREGNFYILKQDVHEVYGLKLLKSRWQVFFDTMEMKFK